MINQMFSPHFFKTSLANVSPHEYTWLGLALTIMNQYRSWLDHCK
jgi:hypothetical protein